MDTIKYYTEIIKVTKNEMEDSINFILKYKKERKKFFLTFMENKIFYVENFLKSYEKIKEKYDVYILLSYDDCNIKLPNYAFNINQKISENILKDKQIMDYTIINHNSYDNYRLSCEGKKFDTNILIGKPISEQGNTPSYGFHFLMFLNLNQMTK